MRNPSLALLFFVAASSFGAQWHQGLPPGITRTEILQLAGEPSSSKSQTKEHYGLTGPVEYLAQIDRYEIEEGYVELTYDKDTLIEEKMHFSQSGAHDSSFYRYFKLPGMDPLIESQSRRDYLNAKQYSVEPKFKWDFVRTSKYPGAVCYRIDDSYLIVFPLLPSGGGLGFFTDKTAKVILLDAKKRETILYRAMDNWQNLRPPGLDDKKLEARMKLFAALETQDSGNRLNSEIIGQPDSTFGAGIPGVVYYLKDALAIGTHFGKELTIHTIDRPGESSRSLTPDKCCRQK